MLLHSRGRLAAIARSYARHDDAEDLLQEILLQVWRGLKDFQERSSVDTWCYRVALNTAISWRRATGRRKHELAAEGGDLDQVAGAVDGSDPIRLLERFMKTLSDTDRALVLMYLENLSGSEMAEITGLSESAVRVRVHRVKRRLADWNASDT